MGIFEGLRQLRELGQLNGLPCLFATEPYPRASAALRGEDWRGSFEGSSAQASVAGSTVSWQTLSALRGSRGAALVVDDRGAASSRRLLKGVGIAAELCSAATIEAAQALVADGELTEGARVVVVITADGTLATESPR